METWDKYKEYAKNDDLEAKKDIEEAEIYAESEDNALTASDDLVKAVGLHFINKNRKAYEKLAKG